MDKLHFSRFISLWPLFGSADATQPPSYINLHADNRGNDRSLKASKNSGQTWSHGFQIIILHRTTGFQRICRVSIGTYHSQMSKGQLGRLCLNDGYQVQVRMADRERGANNQAEYLEREKKWIY